MKRINKYLDKFISRRFQVLLIAIILYIVTNNIPGFKMPFTVEYLFYIFLVYIGFDTIEKFSKGYNNEEQGDIEE